ncbi:tunicamycin resistance protein [Virgibacillus profundi]|uniref:Tunicamycin resistance protein n=1 Tax=Virgibacillus profundi TaxID=2024555 RepID=A0A2A2IDE0_9BACI|nr:AAA family ATPase [Virgibacillus profundi]PAV29647.1 tunicamycin resistance protein [Virgibacillus profundi]PXY53819.1 tunicamycin resistance protein [Virgibacillus profundi]
MIIMINGAFGVGKTTISNGLLEELENSMIYDPEEVGFMLGNIIPEKVKQIEAGTGDFQDLQLWKELTVKVAKLLITKYKVNLIVPMTIRKPEYFSYIINGFKNIDKQTYHFCLTASKHTIYERLRKRGEEEGNWCYQQTEKCLQSFNEYDFGEYIDTENVSTTVIVDQIVEKINL